MIPTPAKLSEDYESFLKVVKEGVRPGDEIALRIGVAMIDQAALMRLSGDILGTECTQSYWIATGGLNFVFILTTKDSREVVARVCRPDVVSGSQWQSPLERRQKVLGEVATLAWLRKHTKIPVPKVYGYNTDSDSGVGSAFLLQERILGCIADHATLRDNLDGRDRFASQIMGYYTELLQNPFPSIGTLTLDGSGEDAVVGPITFSFIPNANLPSTARGPFETSLAWFRTMLEGQASFLESEDFDKNWRIWHPEPSDIPDRDLLHEQLQQLRDLVALFEQKHGNDVEMFVLRHPDLHMPNVLVAYDEIVGIIDWEAAQTAPLWEVGRFPALLADRPFTITDEGGKEKRKAVWKTVLMHVPQADNALRNAKCRWRIRSLVSDRHYLIGPTGSYDFEGDLKEIKELINAIEPT